MFKLFILFVIAVLIVLALWCRIAPNSVLGADWIAWLIGAAVAWAVGKFLDALVPVLKAASKATE